MKASRWACRMAVVATPYVRDFRIRLAPTASDNSDPRRRGEARSLAASRQPVSAARRYVEPRFGLRRCVATNRSRDKVLNATLLKFARMTLAGIVQPSIIARIVGRIDVGDIRRPRPTQLNNRVLGKHRIMPHT